MTALASSKRQDLAYLIADVPTSVDLTAASATSGRRHRDCQTLYSCFL